MLARIARPAVRRLPSTRHNITAPSGATVQKAFQNAVKGTEAEEKPAKTATKKEMANSKSSTSAPPPAASAPAAPAPPAAQATYPPQGHLNSFLPKIVVVGVGGAGGNAVNNMIAQGLQGVDFVVCNTDAQHLERTLAEKKVQLGVGTTGGLGCGAQPNMGQQAAEESAEEILDAIGDANMVFITAGMGGGTGTGAAPVIAQLSLAENMLTVAVVTKPFRFEGKHRMMLADEGMRELQDSVDTMIVVPNQNLLSLATKNTSLTDAFKMADDVLLSGVKSVTDLMVCPGLINLDFADVETVMQGMGNSMMGTGEADGEGRALKAAEGALSNPLLGNLSVSSARGMLVNITGGEDMTLFEVDEAAQRITSEVDDENANIIFGSTFDGTMDGKLRVSVVATGIEVEY